MILITKLHALLIGPLENLRGIKSAFKRPQYHLDKCEASAVLYFYHCGQITTSHVPSKLWMRYGGAPPPPTPGPSFHSLYSAFLNPFPDQASRMPSSADLEYPPSSDQKVNIPSDPEKSTQAHQEGWRRGGAG